jgi:hypothetical protein
MEEEKKDQVMQHRNRMMQMEGDEDLNEPETTHMIPTPPANVDSDPEVIF